MSLSTVSKSLKTLEEDLIVERNDIIRLLQPDKLLEKLSENYAPPNIKERVRLKVQEESGKAPGIATKAIAGVGPAPRGYWDIIGWAICSDAARRSVICLLPAFGDAA